ncbi:MAG: RdgB/HAM1 family non-canonical purine NTP pyrophosphatase [Clostridia bacterium]|nr:RdgB/HAM1 family non-canonical purine NTP pyrophosphatase [Clostridia bacterium]
MIRSSVITTRQPIVIATNNQGKLREFQDVFSQLLFTVISLQELNITEQCEENGNTLYANALIKAKFYKDRTIYPVIADDTGLFVDALNGQPGVYSARYAGIHATHEQNRNKLINQMHGVSNRRAYFECCVVYIDQQGNITTANGRTEGTILSSQQGNQGFGYDSIFYSQELDKPFAMASIQEKNSVSHRAKAIHNLIQQLENK